MRLFLVQHGAARPGAEDPGRPLTAAGRDATTRMARWLAATVPKPDEIRHSSKLRARQTARILSEAVGGILLREVDGLDPQDDVAPLADLLIDARADVMLVGHLPHLGRLASQLLAGGAGRETVRFVPSGVVCLEREEGFRVAWYVTPDLV